MYSAWVRNSKKIRSGCYQRSEKLKHDNGKRWGNKKKRLVFIYKRHPIVFNELQDKQIVYSCRQTHNIFSF